MARCFDRRNGASTHWKGEGALRWAYVPTTDFGPTIEPPLQVIVTRTFGAYQEFTAQTLTPLPLGITRTVFTTVDSTGHNAAVGDTVFAEAASGGIGGGGSFDGLAAGVYEVEQIGPPVGGTSTELRLKNPRNGGESVINVNVNVLMRYVSLSADNDNSYVVTAMTEAGDESEASAEVTAAHNNLTGDGSYNTISWAAAPGARRYRIYKKKFGLFGRIGETDALSFKDANIGFTADDVVTPPIADASLSKPSVVGSFEQRGVLALGQEVWLTASDTAQTLTFHLPVVDTDRINFAVAAGEACPIRHIAELGNCCS